MRIAIVGATGFIGRHVLRGLVEAGHDVAAVHRGATQSELPASVHDIRAGRASLPA